MDISDYFRHREAEARAASASADDLVFEAAPHGRAGHVSGRITLRAGRITLRADSELDAYLQVTEWVVLSEDGFVVEKYAYYLIINGAEVRAWDKDARHSEQPVHGHVGAGHTRIAADEVTLEEVLDGVWDEVADASGHDYAG